METRATADDGEDHQHDGESLHIGGSAECQLCPICVVLQAVGTSRPDVVQHLLAAARELALAVKTVADGHAEAADRARAEMSDRLTRITID